MKIGLVTVHKEPNYGANLQTYATWKFISDLGHDCEVIDMTLRPEPPRFPQCRPDYYRKPKQSLTFQMRMQIRKLFVKFGLKKPIYVPPSIQPKAQLKFNKFNELISYSKRYDKLTELYDNPPQYDLYITGSDQVWNPTQFYCLEPFFLTFATGHRKISYAASIGIEELRDNEKEQFKKWLQSYESISVREKTAKKLLEEITNRTDIEKVSDPTFLLSQDEWLNFAIKPSIKKPYILVFTLGHNQLLIDYAIRLKAETGFDIKVICLMALPNNNNEYESITDACPREFIGYLSQAELVLTDSFHGTVFSLLMKSKNFYTYLFPTAKRNSRMIDLLNLVGLTDHIISNELSETYEELMLREIDHAKITSIIDAERTRCRNWLKKCIEKNI